MTVWTCNVLYKHTSTGEFMPRLWGDDELALMVLVGALGADVVADFQPDMWGDCYRITPQQQLRAVEEFGAVPTDYWEPQAQRAERDGNWAKVASIEMARENVRKGRLFVPVPLLRDPLYGGRAA